MISRIGVFVWYTKILCFATGEQASPWLSLKFEPQHTEFAARGLICKNHTYCTAINLHLLAWQYTALSGMHSLLTSPSAKADSSSNMSELISKIPFQNKEPTTRVGSLFWQRNRDSNPNIQSQSLLCYRYTIPLSLFSLIIIAQRNSFVKWILKNISHFFRFLLSRWEF